MVKVVGVMSTNSFRAQRDFKHKSHLTQTCGSSIAISLKEKGNQLIVLYEEYRKRKQTYSGISGIFKVNTLCQRYLPYFICQSDNTRNTFLSLNPLARNIMWIFCIESNISLPSNLICIFVIYQKKTKIYMKRIYSKFLIQNHIFCIIVSGFIHIKMVVSWKHRLRARKYLIPCKKSHIFKESVDRMFFR